MWTQIISSALQLTDIIIEISDLPSNSEYLESIPTLKISIHF